MGVPSYGIARRVDIGFEETVRLTREALKEQGFGVLTEIDVKKTMKEKLDVDYKPYVILGACNPALAHRALTAEPDIGLMLPCNVVVYEEGPGTSRVEAVAPMAVLGVVESDELAGVGREATERLSKAMDRVVELAGS